MLRLCRRSKQPTRAPGTARLEGSVIRPDSSAFWASNGRAIAISNVAHGLMRAASALVSRPGAAGRWPIAVFYAQRSPTNCVGTR